VRPCGGRPGAFEELQELPSEVQRHRIAHGEAQPGVLPPLADRVVGGRPSSALLERDLDVDEGLDVSPRGLFVAVEQLPDITIGQGSPTLQRE
jgi:hypothetical protein